MSIAVPAHGHGPDADRIPRMDHETRLVEIETRLAFQDLALGELSELVHQQRRELDALRRAFDLATAELGALRDSLASPVANEAPPHY